MACHGPTGRGNEPAKFPALRGQQSVYVSKQLNDYASGARATGPNAIMQTIAKRLSPDDMRNLSSYVARTFAECVAPRLAALLGLTIAARRVREATGGSPRDSATATTPATALSPPPAGAAERRGWAKAAAAKRPRAASATPATLARTNEDGSETVEEPPATAARNPLLAAVASTVAAATSAAAAPSRTAGTSWQEGVNYTRIVPAQPTAVPAGQVEVLEFFWYACPHCYAIDPLVESLEEEQAGLHHLFTRAGDVERGASLAGAALLHAREHGQARPAARRDIQGNPRQQRSLDRRRSDQRRGDRAHADRRS